jgi:hypothetical protein
MTDFAAFRSSRRPAAIEHVMMPRRLIHRFSLAMCLIVANCLLGGCCCLSPRTGQPPVSCTQRWQGASTETFGVDSRARQIEQNLGVK